MTLQELKQILQSSVSENIKFHALNLYNLDNELKFDTIDEALAA